MSNRTLADLAQEYEANSKLLEKQIAQIDEELKAFPYGTKHIDLERKRTIYEDMLFEVNLNASTLKTYYDK